MFKLPPLRPRTPREEVIEVMAEGIFTLVIRGERPHRSKNKTLTGNLKQPAPRETIKEPAPK